MLPTIARNPLGLIAASLITLLISCASPAKDPLPSWNNGAPKQAIQQFVQKVSDRGSPDYVPPEERIAVFDNDGTLWVEQPLYVEVIFAADQMKASAASHPEWNTTIAFQKVITGPEGAILQLAPADQFAVAFAVHSGSADDYSAAVARWLAASRHPRFNRPYTSLAYQPMLEVIALLRANDFQVYTVTGSEIGFARVANEKAFGIPRTHVIGTLLKTRFDGAATPAQLLAQPDVLIVDDGDGKPISIANVIGRRPIAAFGNSDGDMAMLQWTKTGPGARLAMIVHHDDAEREFAYDRASPVGHLEKALDAAPQQGWTVLSMKSDWKNIFPDQSK